MHIAITRFRVKDGVAEHDFLAASDAVHRDFETAHAGMLRRILARTPDGHYLDIDFFADEHAMVEVMTAAEADPTCGTYFEMMELADEPIAHEVVKTYD